LPDNKHSQSIRLCVAEIIKLLVVKISTVFVQIKIRSGQLFCKLGKEALSSTAGLQTFEIFQNGTAILVLLTWCNNGWLWMGMLADNYRLSVFEIRV